MIFFHLPLAENFSGLFPARGYIKKGQHTGGHIVPVELGKVTDRIVHGYITMWSDARKRGNWVKRNILWKIELQSIGRRKIVRRLG